MKQFTSLLLIVILNFLIICFYSAFYHHQFMFIFRKVNGKIFLVRFYNWNDYATNLVLFVYTFWWNELFKVSKAEKRKKLIKLVQTEPTFLCSVWSSSLYFVIKLHFFVLWKVNIPEFYIITVNYIDIFKVNLQCFVHKKIIK